jgi:hypothetical protein
MLLLKSVFFPQSLIYERGPCFKRHGERNKEQPASIFKVVYCSFKLSYAERQIKNPAGQITILGRRQYLHLLQSKGKGNRPELVTRRLAKQNRGKQCHGKLYSIYKISDILC